MTRETVQSRVIVSCWWSFTSFRRQSDQKSFLAFTECFPKSFTYFTTSPQLTWWSSWIATGSLRTQSRLASCFYVSWIIIAILSELPCKLCGVELLSYLNYFSYTRNAISIRTGGLLPIEDCRMVRMPKNEPSHWQTLCIEEPFDLTNTARSTYDWDIFSKIKSVFFHSWRRLNETKNIDQLFQEPLFVQQVPAHQPYFPQINTQMLQEMKYLMYKQATSQPLTSPLISPATASNPPPPSSAEISSWGKVVDIAVAVYW